MATFSYLISNRHMCTNWELEGPIGMRDWLRIGWGLVGDWKQDGTIIKGGEGLVGDWKQGKTRGEGEVKREEVSSADISVHIFVYWKGLLFSPCRHRQ